MNRFESFLTQQFEDYMPGGNDHCSNDVLSSIADRDKKLDDTNHSEFDVKVK